MGDVMEVKCQKALLQRKILWCTALDNFCGCQRHCHVKGHAVLTDEAKNCPVRNTEQNHKGE